MDPDLARRIGELIGRDVRRARALGGGSVAAVWRVELEGAPPVVAKTFADAAALACEAWMLRHLARVSRLPVPAVLGEAEGLLILSLLDAEGTLDAAAERHAAELIAALHGIRAPSFGLERDTVIGGLPQPNPQSPRWLPFFAEHRLIAMARQARDAGRLPPALSARVERLAGRLERWLAEPAAPALLHGDLWSGNVLCTATPAGSRIAGFIDPAIYYGDPEIELAFATLFGSFGEPFFRRYRELRPIAPGFFEERRELYNLYPLLVHVRLFGGAYVGQVQATLARFGA